jgi:hypothetical protein
MRQATPGPKALRVTLTGQLRIPAGLSLGAGVRLVGNHGGSLVSDNGGGLLSDRGAGVVANGGGSLAGGRLTGAGDATDGKLRLMAVEAAAVEGARVFLADAAGRPLPDFTEGKTDARGQFTLPQVPGEATFVVVAHVPTSQGRTAVFRTVVKLGRFGATTEIDPATTLVTASVLDGLPRGELGELNPAKFQTATEATARNLTQENLPDFTDSLQVKAAIDALTAQVKELRDVLVQVRDELAALRSSIDALRKEATTGNEDGLTGDPTPGPSSPLPFNMPSPAPLPARSAPEPWVPPSSSCEPQPYVAVPPKGVWAVEVRETQAGWPPFLSPLLHRGLRNGEVVNLLAPAGCKVWLVYQNEKGASLGAEPFVFPPRDNSARPLTLPPPEVATQAPPAVATQAPPYTSDCNVSVRQAFMVLDGRTPGAGAPITRVEMVQSRNRSTLEVRVTPGVAFLADVLEGCPLVVSLIDDKGNRLRQLELTVTPGSKGTTILLPL